MKSLAVFIAISLLNGKLNMIKAESLNSPLKVEVSKPRNQNTSIEEPKAQNTSTTASPATIINVTSPKEISIFSSSSKSTAATTTVVAAVKTTTAPLQSKNTNATENRMKSGSIESIVHPPSYFCKCDFVPNNCDISCCCDIDCSSEALKTFECDEDHVTFDNYQFQHGLPSCKINEGWFCLFIDNSRSKMRKVCNSKVNSKKYFWPDPLLLNFRNEEKRGFYKEGDPILLYNDLTEEVETLDIPYSFINSACQAYEPLRHLQDFTRECIIPSERAQTFYNSFLKKITKSSILRFPKNTDSNEIITQKHNDNVGDCIKSELYYCAGNISSCKEWTNTSLEVENEIFCTLIKINMHHNFTSIEKCQIYLIEEIGSTYLWQKFEIKFFSLNDTVKPNFPISGPLGYTERSPIIVSKLVPTNESAGYTEAQRILNYFHENTSKHKNDFHIPMPGSSGGDCLNEKSNVVKFGEDFFIQCNIRLNDTIIDSTTNFTTVCYEIQMKSFQVLLNSQNFSPDLELYVSEFGLPRNRTDHWIRMQTSYFEHPNIFTVYSHESYSFSCQNMIITVKNVFFTENVMVNGVPNQNVIRIAKTEMGSRVDLSFKLEDEIVVPLSFHVMFYDILDFNSYSNAGSFEHISSFTNLIFFSFVILMN